MKINCFRNLDISYRLIIILGMFIQGKWVNHSKNSEVLLYFNLLCVHSLSLAYMVALKQAD